MKKFNSFIDKTKIYLWKSATSFTSAMTILCSIIMCFKSLSCSATGKCSSQKIQGTDGGPAKAVEPPGLSGRESGSRMQSSLSGRGTREERNWNQPCSLERWFLTFCTERSLKAFYILKKENPKTKNIAPERTLLSFKHSYGHTAEELGAMRFAWMGETHLLK